MEHENIGEQIAEIRTIVTTISEDVGEIKKDLHGNGSEGLVVDVAILKMKQKTRDKIMIGLIVGLGVTLVPWIFHFLSSSPSS